MKQIEFLKKSQNHWTLLQWIPHLSRLDHVSFTAALPDWRAYPLPVEAALPDELHDDDGVGAVVGHAPDLDNVVVREPLHEPHLPLHVVHRALGQRVRVLDHLIFTATLCGQIHSAGIERWGGGGWTVR